MFTGLIRCLGQVVEWEPMASGARIRLRFLPELSAQLPGPLAVGDSVAVNGACLTVLDPTDQGFSADLSAETLACTTLQNLKIGDWLNLEPAMCLGDRLDGHMVTGHVDGVGSVRSKQDMGDSALWWFNAPGSLLPLIAAKGSIAVDGISLTVNETDENGFRVQLLELTQKVTTLGKTRENQPVNLEVDLIARYVARLAQFNLPGNGKITT